MWHPDSTMFYLFICSSYFILLAWPAGNTVLWYKFQQGKIVDVSERQILCAKSRCRKCSSLYRFLAHFFFYQNVFTCFKLFSQYIRPHKLLSVFFRVVKKTCYPAEQ